MTRMQTRIIRVDAVKPDDQMLLPAAEALRRGELVAFPTETVYGLGANALDPEAVARIFSAKGRPGDNPLIVHIASLEDLKPLVREITPLAEKLFRAFSPGPLTLILPKSDAVPSLVTAGLDTVAVRIPAHPVARRLIELAGVPVAAPSANRSGRPSPTRAWHVEVDLEGRIPFIIEAGCTQFGLESTVVDARGEVPVILRPGAITASAIREIAGAVAGIGSSQAGASSTVLLPQELAKTPRSPGMKYRHYAPKARLQIADSIDPEMRWRQLAGMIDKMQSGGLRVGIFVCRQALAYLPMTVDELSLDNLERPCLAERPAGETLSPVTAVIYGPEPDAMAAGVSLFDALRCLDQAGVRVIIAEGLPERGFGSAYMNRLRKAASHAGSDPEPGLKINGSD